MRKNILLMVIVGVLVILEILVFLFFGGGIKTIASYFVKDNPLIGGIILFENAGCKQCVKVDNFITSNKVKDKVVFTRLEVFPDDANYDLLSDRAQFCGLDNSQIGVPFLWDGKNWIIGYVDVIAFFQEKIAKKP